MNEPTAQVETPNALPVEVDIAAYRAQRENPTQPVIATETPAAIEDAAPDSEVDGDPDFRAAVDEVETPADNETPQQRAARTKKNKEAARQGWHTRRANKLTRLERENLELRQAAAQAAPPDRSVSPVPANQPAARQAETDQTDPEPSFESFAAAHPDHADPYAGYMRELARWDRRQEQRTAESARRDTARAQEMQRVGAQVSKHRESGSTVYPDFEATFSALGNALRGSPADEVVFRALGDITDDKVGRDVLYRLGKNLVETKAAIAQGELALVRHIGRLEAAVTAVAAKPAAASPVVTSAPPPHQPVGAAATASATFDLAKLDPNSVDISAVRRAKAAGQLTRR